MSGPGEVLEELLAARLEAPAREWFERARREVAEGPTADRFAALLSLASRHSPRGALAPGADACRLAGEVVEGWNPERWTTLDAVRVGLLLGRGDLGSESGAAAVEDAFRHADVGEACALYRALGLLPGPERFAWRAGEGCRSNITALFEAVACDSPFPARVLDDVAWRQLCIKAVFIGAPLWRVHGLDGRLDAELARMALDLAEERRSAGRGVQPELWLCLGAHGGERAVASLECEWAGSDVLGRRAAAYALARAGCVERLRELADGESDPAVAASARDALAGNTAQATFRALDPSSEG
ncbi:MAG TPA: EboA domain-containing protein [Planctomycetota bacterium]|nr:EboA domain-containing protein [Planctomycetota bacterium]